jgi:rRNA maturation endonuclease Nob1
MSSEKVCIDCGKTFRDKTGADLCPGCGSPETRPLSERDKSKGSVNGNYSKNGYQKPLW